MSAPDCLMKSSHPYCMKPGWRDIKLTFSYILSSEGGALRGLRELYVLLDEHLPLQFLQHGLDRVLSVPAGQDGHSAGVHLKIGHIR